MEHICVVCYMFWILSTAEGDTITKVAGSRVILHCNNSNTTLVQLTWKMNGGSLFSFISQKTFTNPEADRLNITVRESGYTLVIERVGRAHTGNYTCETNTIEGTQEQKWELIIAEPEVERERRGVVELAVAITVPCVCLVIFALALIILQRACKRNPATAETERTEDIYENCLEIERRRNQLSNYKHRAH